MAKLQFNGRQYTITISEELIKRMNWKKGDEIFISKSHNEDFLYIEKQQKHKVVKSVGIR